MGPSSARPLYIKTKASHHRPAIQNPVHGEGEGVEHFKRSSSSSKASSVSRSQSSHTERPKNKTFQGKRFPRSRLAGEGWEGWSLRAKTHKMGGGCKRGSGFWGLVKNVTPKKGRESDPRDDRPWEVPVLILEQGWALYGAPTTCQLDVTIANKLFCLF